MKIGLSLCDENLTFRLTLTGQLGFWLFWLSNGQGMPKTTFFYYTIKQRNSVNKIENIFAKICTKSYYLFKLQNDFLIQIIKIYILLVSPKIGVRYWRMCTKIYSKNYHIFRLSIPIYGFITTVNCPS